MTAPLCHDPALVAIDVLLDAARKVWDPARPDDCKPLGGGVDTVRFFASAAIPTANWDSVGCEGPFAWVRLVSRYRSDQFPEQSLTAGVCTGRKVLELETGIARCVTIEEQPDWAVVAEEMEISRDDSFQIETILCLAAGELNATHNISLVASDVIVPFGPDGGIQGWSGVLYVGI